MGRSRPYAPSARARMEPHLTAARAVVDGQREPEGRASSSRGGGAAESPSGLILDYAARPAHRLRGPSTVVTTLCPFGSSIAYGRPRHRLAVASHRRHQVTQLEALYHARQFPAAHTEQHGGLALVPTSQRQRVREVPSHGGLECLEIVSHVNWVHSTNSLLLPPEQFPRASSEAPRPPGPGGRRSCVRISAGPETSTSRTPGNRDGWRADVRRRGHRGYSSPFVSTCTTTSEGWSAANRDRGRHLGACW